MKKRDLLEAIKDIGLDDEVVVALNYPKPDEGYEIGEEEKDSSDSDSPEDDEDDEGVVDNEDGTVTEAFDIDSIDVTEYDDEETGKPAKLASLIVVMEEDDGDEEGEEETSED